MTFNKRKLLASLVASWGISASTGAMAAPEFTIDLAAILGGAPQLYTGDFFSGTSTELLTTTGNNHDGSGWMQISGLSNNAVGQVPFGTNAFSPFNMYVTFTLKDHLTSGTINTAGSTYSLDELNFMLWVDPSKNTTLTAANVIAGISSAATVGGTTADDYVLGFGTLLYGVASLNAVGGAGLNSTETFALCNGAGSADMGGVALAFAGCTNDVGVNFFVDPNPFYDLAFTEFNNTSQGFAVAANGDLVINSASGGVDFNRIPEPASIALLGLGLLGLGASRRRHNIGL